VLSSPTLRGDAADISGKRIAIKRVLVPLDGSELADRTVEFLLGLTHISELEFVLVGVVHNPDDVTFVKRRLHVAADRFRGRSAAAISRVILGGVAEGVVRGADVPVLLLTPTMLTANDVAGSMITTAT
jgi:nucleotide-binding universal stress UspA family protein